MPLVLTVHVIISRFFLAVAVKIIQYNIEEIIENFVNILDYSIL